MKIIRTFAGQLLVCGCAVLLAVPALAQEAPEAPAGPPAESPLFEAPETISENFDAALLMVKLARMDLAKYYIEQLLKLNPTDDDLMALRAEHGTGTFLELAGIDELNPPATTMLQQLNAAVRRRAETPGYVEGLIQQLNGSARKRAEALAELRHLGAAAVPPLVNALDGQLGVSREVITVTLARLGTETVPALVGALQSPSANTRGVAAEVLGVVGSPDDMVWLWFPAFSENEEPGTQRAARESIALLKYGERSAVTRVTSDRIVPRMLALALDHLQGTFTWPQLNDPDAPVSVWIWDETAGTVVEHPVTKDQASTFYAERLAREASLLAPANESAPVLLLAALFQREVKQTGWQGMPTGPGTAHDLALRSGPDVNAQVLRLALDHNLSAAALGSLRVLALNGSTDLLISDADESAVVAALDSPDQRVQFAAATTILHWEPVKAFAGARRVIEILARALNSQQQGASVVMDPNVGRASQTASLFQQLGYSTALVQTGMEGFRLAAEHGDIVLAVLHPNVIRWELSQTIANLRADARTARIPVVVYGPPEAVDHASLLTSQYQNVQFVNATTDALDVGRGLAPLLASLSPPPLTQQQRSEHKKDAAFWLQRIAIRNVENVFNLAPAEEALTQAASDPSVSHDALIALGAIRRNSVQRTFLTIATSSSVPADRRELAALQLAFHIQRHGTLLTESELAPLQGIWESEQNAAVKTALASVIGSLGPKPAAARAVILSRPLSSTPLLNGATEKVQVPPTEDVPAAPPAPAQ